MLHSGLSDPRRSALLSLGREESIRHCLKCVHPQYCCIDANISSNRERSDLEVGLLQGNGVRWIWATHFSHHLHWLNYGRHEERGGAEQEDSQRRGRRELALKIE